MYEIYYKSMTFILALVTNIKVIMTDTILSFESTGQLFNKSSFLFYF